ncbi:MAG: deoxynucleoside kinase [Paraclostridium sp.]
MIVTAGTIGVGKSTLAKLLGEHFGTDVFYEKVEDNKILPLFYTMNEEELLEKRIPFLLQLDFLDSRFKLIKQTLVNDNNILDRSIFEDVMFARANAKLGRISELELEIYENLFFNMMEELKELPKKAPDLLIYLKADFDVIIDRVMKRGREYEIDENLIEYYRVIWENYEDWIKEYNYSPVLVIDTNDLDLANNEKDVAYVMELIENKLKEVRGK